MQTNSLFSPARRWATRLALLALLLALGVLAAAPTHAAPKATRLVSPSGTNSGDCTASACKTITYALTQAVAGDTISVAAGTYSVANGETLPLVPGVDVTISGAGASSTTIDGASTSPVMRVNGGRTVTVQNVTIANGRCNSCDGGGIANYGTLTVSNSTFSGNSATGNGGGGIYNENTLTVSNSTFSGNSATGGGIYNYLGTLTVSNSTFSNNAAGLGGGILNMQGTLNYANTIIANSTSGGDCVVFTVMGQGTIGTNTNNLVEDGSCSAALSGDPQLGALANNGGATQTFALLANSPAIDRGDAATCAASPINGLDQRGQARNDLQCDIGAYEMQMSDSNTTTLNPEMTMRTFGPPRVGIQYSGTNPGSTTATKVTNWAGGTPANALGAWWELTPTTNTGLNLTLR